MQVLFVLPIVTESCRSCCSLPEELDPEAAQKKLLFLPGKPHAGIEAADPMLVLRNSAYPISFAQRQ